MTEVQHPSENTWKVFMSDGLGPAQDLKLVQHLLSECKGCKAKAARFWPGKAGDEGTDERMPRLGTDWIQSTYRMSDQVLADEVEAERLFENLIALEPAHQRIFIRNQTRCSTWALTRLVVEKAFSLRFDDGMASHNLAEIGVELSERVGDDDAEEDLRRDLQARACAVLGNAERIQSDLRASERSFRKALALLKEGTGDPLERGLVLTLLAALRYDQSRYRDSIRLARRSFRCYRSIGDAPGMAAAELQEGASLDLDGEPDRAIETYARVLDYVEVGSQQHLAARHNMVAALRSSGRHLEAMELLGEIRHDYERLGDRINIARMHWLEGEVAVSLDRPHVADAAFRAAAAVFIDQRMAFSAALVSLELAALLVGQNRTAEVKELAMTVMPIFESLDIHDEAMAALILFREAVQREDLSIELVREIVLFLQEAEHDPSLAFLPSLDR